MHFHKRKNITKKVMLIQWLACNKPFQLFKFPFLRRLEFGGNVLQQIFHPTQQATTFGLWVKLHLILDLLNSKPIAFYQ